VSLKLTLSVLAAKARRDSGESLAHRVSKGARYLVELISAKYYLRAVNVVGAHARTLALPRIINLGRMEMGRHLLIRSILVPAEIGTGHHGILRIGDGVRINYGTSIYAERDITIGHRVRIGPYTSIVDTDFHDPYDHSVVPDGTPVVIEDDVWIGARCTVLKGVRIGRGAVVGTGAIVTKDVPAFTVVAGVPAKHISALDPSRFVQESYA